MITNSSKYRPVETAGCHTCFARAGCGGLDGHANEMFGCYDRCRQVGMCADKATCEWTCPNNEKVFWKRWAEVGGWTSFDTMAFPGIPVEILPNYIPQIRPGIKRQKRAAAPVVAYQLYEALRAFRTPNGKGYSKCSPAEFRSRLGLREDAHVLLVGVAPDTRIEGFWSQYRVQHFPELIADAGVLAITAPNFSNFTNVPRHETLYNRKRMILVAETFISRGVPVIPHFNATHFVDWGFWTEFLIRQPELNCFCKEFQTGNREVDKREATINAMAEMQRVVGRELHPILVGGRSAMIGTKNHFQTLSVVDSEPAMKTIKRRCLVSTANQPLRWNPMKSSTNASMSGLLDHNIGAYGARITAELSNRTRSLGTPSVCQRPRD